MRLSSFFLLVSLALLSSSSRAQSSSNATSPSPTLTSPPVSLSLTTREVTITVATTSGNHSTQYLTVIPAVYNVSITSSTATSTSTSSTTSSSSTPSATANPLVLDTRIDPAFGVLGALLILTGLPSAFWGHKNRWTSFFLTGFYTFALSCAVLIIKFGVIPADNPPSKTLRGMYVLSSSIAGFAGGAIAIFFWKGARYGIGAWGGLSLALWIQCFSDGGVIKPIGYRWILYISCAVVGFTLSTISKIHYHVLLLSTALTGSSAFMLGVDCYTTAGLKEFYIWNLGFSSLFPKIVNRGVQFPVSQAMQIELGLIAAMALMGIALQFRILTVLQKKLREIAMERRIFDTEAEAAAAERFAQLDKERNDWEKDHPSLTKFGRQDSTATSTPLIKGRDLSPVPGERRSSSYTFVDGQPRYHSGVSDLKITPVLEDVPSKKSKQSLGALPALDFGQRIEENVPDTFIASDELIKKVATPAELEDLRRKEELMSEIRTLRRSIEALKSETPAPSSSSESRRPSMTSRRTLSIDAGTALHAAPHLRPPREIDPRSRVYSMELSSLGRTRSLGDPIMRPTSAPPQDEEWETYIQERKLLQPPAGITPPIPTTPIAPRMPIPSAVQEALSERKRKESTLGAVERRTDSSEDVPLARVAQHKRSSSANNPPMTILPPRKPPIAAPAPQRPSPPRTLTFEELNERHREKMRDLQAPLTQAEKEHADVEAAKQRWEKAMATEKQVVARRQAEKAAQAEKKRREEGLRDKNRGSLSPQDPRRRHSRSLSADKLGGSNSRRLSVMKVEDWQRYQQDAEMGVIAESPGGSGARQGSRSFKADSVPFPDAGKLRDSRRQDRRKSRDPLS